MFDLLFSRPKGGLQENLQFHARRSRATALLFIGLMSFVVIFLVMYFYSTKGIEYISDRIRPATITSSPQTEITLGSATLPTPKDSRKQATAEMQLRYLDREESSVAIIAVITAFARLGAVVVGLYFVQILFQLARYHFRIADHLDVVSQALEVQCKEPPSFGEITTLLSVTHIDLGKAPTTPVEKILDVVKEALGKVR